VLAPPRRLYGPLLIGVVTAVAVLAPSAAVAATPTAAQIELQIQTQSQALEQIVEKYDYLTEQLTSSQTAIARLQTQLTPLKSNVDAARARVASLAVQAYKGETLDEFSAVVSAPDTAEVVQRLVVIGGVSRAEQAQISAAVDASAVQQAELARLTAMQTTYRATQFDLGNQKATITTQLAQLYALRAKVHIAAPPSGAGTPAPYVPGAAGKAVSFAYAQLGKPYAWAQAGPNSYDCSGLTMAAWRTAGVALSHNAAEQWNEVSHEPRGALQPGDLVFYLSLAHVAIYVGNGQVIHAPEPGDVVRLASIDMMTPYGYGRP
jgi:cell wall-associated NlpC family hydrolase